MTGKTHRAGGFLCSVIGFAILRHKGLLMADVNEGLQWLMMYPFCMWGSVVSDLDHHWQSSPMKDPPSFVVNKMLHITAPIQKSLEKAGVKKGGLYKVAKTFNASHRSWQTHSDLTLAVIIYLLYAVLNNIFKVDVVDAILLRFILMGVCLGIIAHFILDMLTPEGVWSIALVVLKKVLRLFNPRIKHFPEKLRLVPHVSFFSTAGSWEVFVNKVLKVLNILAMIYLIWSILGISNLIPYEISLGG